MAKQSDNNPGTVNIIAGSTKIIGDVITDTDIRIDGELKGNLTTKGRLIIGQSGTINGEISCNNAEVEGTVEGKIIVNGLLDLKATSNLTGEITTKQLMIEPGAIFTGNCKMINESEGKLK